MPPTIDNPGADRLARLEEELAFAQRTIEQLHEEVLALGGGLAEAVKRVSRLESRVESLGAGSEEDPD